MDIAFSENMRISKRLCKSLRLYTYNIQKERIMFGGIKQLFTQAPFLSLTFVKMSNV